jgi:eukaryotic-like serine/threonine-protein kinase
MDDQRTIELLEQYVSALHAGDEHRCARILEENPELRAVAGCLDALESLAPPARLQTTRVADDAPTLRSDARSFAQTTDNGDDSYILREFGKYELLDEIGRGGMGVVYRARQADLNRVVALKMILSSRLASGDDVKRFYREARAAGGLRHRNIVSIHEAGHFHGQHYFAMDLIQGRSLASHLRAGPLDAEQAARWLSTVARAVQYLHDQGVLHRDLKPSNILIDESGVPYVTDFGLAKVFHDSDGDTQSGIIVGTPGYMSPEQAAGRVAEISTRSDVYGLGAILYEMLTGRPPFRDENQLNTILQVLEGEPTLPHRLNRRVPDELERICLRCLEKSPERRYISAGDLADDLDRFLKHEAIVARPAGFGALFRRWVRREPGLVARLAGLLLAGSIVQARYSFVGTDLPYHLKIMSLFCVWGVLSFILQRLMRRERLEEFVRFAWSAADVLLLSMAFQIAEGQIGLLMIGYPLLIAAAGLWFRVRLVVFSTAACVIASSAMFWSRGDQQDPLHFQLIYTAVLLVLGWIVGYQVHRVRVLSRYFEQQRLP